MTNSRLHSAEYFHYQDWVAVARLGAVWLESGDVVNLVELIIPKIAFKYSALLPALVKVLC